MKKYAMHYPTFFREPVTVMIEAETAGRAKYLSWLRFSDAYDLTFIEYLKIVKVTRLD